MADWPLVKVAAKVAEPSSPIPPESQRMEERVDPAKRSPVERRVCQGTFSMGGGVGVPAGESGRERRYSAGRKRRDWVPEGAVARVTRSPRVLSAGLREVRVPGSGRMKGSL